MSDTFWVGALMAAVLLLPGGAQAASLQAEPAKLGSASTNKAAEATKAEEFPDAKVETKEVTGELVHVGKRAISVEFSRTKHESFEMLLPLDEETRFERVKTLADLKPGDTVRVQYEQTYRDGDTGERVILKTVAKTISLRRSGDSQALNSAGAGTR